MVERISCRWLVLEKFLLVFVPSHEWQTFGDGLVTLGWINLLKSGTIEGWHAYHRLEWL